MIDILTWFFDQEDSWPWVLGHEECGIVSVEKMSNDEDNSYLARKHIYITLKSGRLISVVQFVGSLPNLPLLAYEAVELDPISHRLMGDPELYYGTAELFSQFARG